MILTSFHNKLVFLCRLIGAAIVLAASHFFLFIHSHSSLALSDPVREQIRTRIESAEFSRKIIVGEELIHASTVLPRFYEQRAYHPAWSNKRGLRSAAEQLIEAIREADREGLNPFDYHLFTIEKILHEVAFHEKTQKADSAIIKADLDLLLTDAFLIYASHLLAGRINPETIDSEWHAQRREADLVKILHSALDSNKIKECLIELIPPQIGYAKLRQTLEKYRKLSKKEGWNKILDGPKMQKGDSGERIDLLRRRLISSDDLEELIREENNLFNDTLEIAVKKFQKRHGLSVDGIVGPATLAALNVTIEERIQQIEANLERWRWLPQDLANPYILINIANFELDVIENGRIPLTMRIVVGKQYRRTPVFSDKMTYLVLNPRWHIPHKIAAQDILREVLKDQDYLKKQNIKVLDGWGADAKEMDPETIDWSNITRKNFHYRLRQEPGPKNALGRIKFMFPNQFNVYLHDTPAPELFEKTVRVFSSGCIRIEKPIELAMYVLKSDPAWTREKILAAIGKGTEQTVPLPEPISIHLLYWTAWVDENGLTHFRNDIYKRDQKLVEALQDKPPALRN